MKTFESEKEIMETKLKQCKGTKAHYRNKMKKIQTRLRKTKTKSCKHQLKTIEYERSNEASNLENQILGLKTEIQELRLKSDNQKKVIADYKAKAEVCAAEVNAQRSMNKDLQNKMEYDMEQQIEECNQTVEDAERYCSDKVNTENDVGQEYKWDLAEAQNLIDDERQTANSYKQNYEWCTGQLEVIMSLMPEFKNAGFWVRVNREVKKYIRLNK